MCRTARNAADPEATRVCLCRRGDPGCLLIRCCGSPPPETERQGEGCSQTGPRQHGDDVTRACPPLPVGEGEGKQADDCHEAEGADPAQARSAPV
jgi:hypothetical protein